MTGFVCPVLSFPHPISTGSQNNLSKYQSDHITTLLKTPLAFHITKKIQTPIMARYNPTLAFISQLMLLSPSLMTPQVPRPCSIYMSSSSPASHLCTCCPQPGTFFLHFLRWQAPFHPSGINWNVIASEKDALLLLWHGTLFLSQYITICDYFIYLSVSCLPPTPTSTRLCTPWKQSLPVFSTIVFPVLWLVL